MEFQTSEASQPADRHVAIGVRPVKLLHHWQEYQDAIRTRPYDPDRVQALGMRFAQTYRSLQPIIERNMKKEPGTLEYSDKHEVIAMAKWMKMMGFDREDQPKKMVV